MQTNDVIAAIARMPREFRRRQDVSMLALLKESGCVGNSRDITIAALRAHFATHADDLNGWVLNSYDNRSSPAWYVAEPSRPDDKWVVGHQPGGQRQYFDSAAEACAVYVKRWLEVASGFTEHAP
jgi:hypothetical protein